MPTGRQLVALDLTEAEARALLDAATDVVVAAAHGVRVAITPALTEAMTKLADALMPDVTRVA